MPRSDWFCGGLRPGVRVCRRLPPHERGGGARGGGLPAGDESQIVPGLLPGGPPVAVALGAYNAYYLGSPLAFGQTEAAKIVALQKTGSSDVWQTPLWLGAAGQFLSPSRGLLVFSPFLIAAFGGGYLAWRRPQFADLRPLTIAIVLMLPIEFAHFDWWGGWSYGYRHVVDPAALLTLLLIPVIPWLYAERSRLAVYLVLLAWSIFVQFLGAFAYDLAGWNAGSAPTSSASPARPGQSTSRTVRRPTSWSRPGGRGLSASSGATSTRASIATGSGRSRIIRSIITSITTRSRALSSTRR